MMKKLFFLFCALMLIGIGAWAQTNGDSDVSFTERMNTTDASSWTAPQDGTGPSEKSWGIEEYIQDGASAGKVLYQTIYGLPAGTYEVKFYAFAKIKKDLDTDRWGGEGKTQGYAQAGSTTHTSGITIPTKTSSSFKDTEWSDESDLITIEIELNAGEALEYGIQNASAGGQWFGIKAKSLTHKGAVEAITLSDGEAVEVEEAEFGHWSIELTDEDEADYDIDDLFEYNSKSTVTDASGITQPFIEYWIGEGDVLPAATISHYDIWGLPKGYYKVSVDARAYFNSESNGDGDENSTITFTAGTESANIVTEGSSDESNNLYYGTYVLILNFEEDVNKLDKIGFTVGEGTNCYWLSWKNLKVEYIGEEMTYTIGEPQCSAMVAVPDKTVDIVFNDCTYPITVESLENLTLNNNVNITVNKTTVTGELSKEGYTATVTITIPETITADVVTIVVPEGLLYWNVEDVEDEAKVKSKGATFTLTTPQLKDGEYLIINADNGYYLGGGLTYGTQATQLAKPQFFGLTQQEDGTYTLNSHQYTNATKHYLGSDLYLDSESADWIIVHNDDDSYTIYNAAAGGYLTGNGFQNEVKGQTTPSATSYWKFITKEEVISGMDDASMNNPVDVTALIGAPELKSKSNDRPEGVEEDQAPWTVTTGTVSFGDASGATANCAESKNSTNGFNVSQEITLPKAGTYLLSAQGFHDGSATDIVLYAGDDSTSAFPELTTSISSMADAYQAFLREEYTVEAITIEASSDSETVTIGFKGTNSSDWVVMGELELLYLGTAESIDWTMYDVGWGTLILPFDAKIPVDEDGNEELTLYTGNSIFVSGSDILFGNQATSIKANTPYIVMSNNEYEEGDSTKYTFSGYPINEEDSYSDGNLLVGTFKDMHYNSTSSNDNDFVGDGTEYVLQYHSNEGLNFYPIISTSSNVTLTAYHCYMVLNNSVQPTSLNIPAVLSAGRYNDDTTGIVAVERDAIVNEAIYDLSGRRVAKATKGVYIINGKKVLVK